MITHWHPRQLGLLLIVLGCSGDIPTESRVLEYPGPVITVSQDAVRWSVDTAIVVVLENPNNASVFYAACPLYRLQRYTNEWTDMPVPLGWPQGQAACAPRELLPGDSTRYSVPLTNDFVPAAGWYRLVLNLHKDSSGQTPWGEGNRVSPAIRVDP